MHYKETHEELMSRIKLLEDEKLDIGYYKSMNERLIAENRLLEQELKQQKQDNYLLTEKNAIL